MSERVLASDLAADAQWAARHTQAREGHVHTLQPAFG